MVSVGADIYVTTIHNKKVNEICAVRLGSVDSTSISDSASVVTDRKTLESTMARSPQVIFFSIFPGTLEALIIVKCDATSM